MVQSGQVRDDAGDGPLHRGAPHVYRGEELGMTNPDGPEADLLEGRPEPGVGPRLGSSWTSASRRRRLVAVVAVLLLILPAMAAVAVFGTRSWLAERSQRDQVSVTATVDVAVSTKRPLSGRIDYFVAIRNTGSSDVRIAGLTHTDARLRIRSRDFATILLAPGSTANVPISVRLDCSGLPIGAGALLGTVTATPPSGRARDVPTSLDRSLLLTNVAQTLCEVRPELTDRELSGPVGS